jgi:hypothetical protein
MASRQRSEPPDPARRLFGWAGVGLLFLVGSGCGGGGPQNEAVSGSVTWKGQPLDQGTMEFVPAGGQGVSIGAVIQDGRYQLLSTPGLAPGMYQVRIFSRESPMRRSNPNAPPDTELIDPKAKERIPPKYNLKTQLQAEVKKGGSNTFDFHLE